MDNRDSLGIRSIGADMVFAGKAGSTDRDGIVDFGNGFGSDYESESFPSRKDFNEALSYATAVCADVNKFGGSLPWDAGIEYAEGAIVIRYDPNASRANMYYAITASAGKDPLTEHAYWQDFRDFLGIENRTFDLVYKKISYYNGSSTDRTGTTGDNIVYSVDGFQDENKNQIEGIRFIIVNAYASGAAQNLTAYVRASMPDDPNELFVIMGSGAQYDYAETTIPVPVNPTGTIRLFAENSNSKWEIIGCMRVVN